MDADYETKRYKKHDKTNQRFFAYGVLWIIGLKGPYYTCLPSLGPCRLPVASVSSPKIADRWLTHAQVISFYAICHAHDFRYQALSLRVHGQGMRLPSCINIIIYYSILNSCTNQAQSAKPSACHKSTIKSYIPVYQQSAIIIRTHTFLATLQCACWRLFASINNY